MPREIFIGTFKNWLIVKFICICLYLGQHFFQIDFYHNMKQSMMETLQLFLLHVQGKYITWN